MSANNNTFLLDKLQEDSPTTVKGEDFFNTTLSRYDKYEEDSWRKGSGYSCPNFPIFNEKMEGLTTGFYLFGGESNMGKSAMMTNLLWDYATHEENNLFGLYFPLDDTYSEITPRLISMIESIPISVASKPARYQQIIEDGLENSSYYQELLEKRKHGQEVLANFYKRFKLVDCEDEDNPITCAEQIIDYCKKVKDYLQGYDPNYNLIVGIDSLFDLNFISKNFSSDKQKNDYVSQEVKNWAKRDLDCPVFGTVHLRKIDRRRADISDIKESGRYVYDASATFLIHNDVSRNGQNASIYYTTPDSAEALPIIEIQWAKNKKSSFKGRTYCHFIPNYSKVIECDKKEADRFDSLIYASK